jgi:hypothetical protein
LRVRAVAAPPLFIHRRRTLQRAWCNVQHTTSWICSLGNIRHLGYCTRLQRAPAADTVIKDPFSVLGLNRAGTVTPRSCTITPKLRSWPRSALRRPSRRLLSPCPPRTRQQSSLWRIEGRGAKSRSSESDRRCERHPTLFSRRVPRSGGRCSPTLRSAEPKGRCCRRP